MSFRHCNEKEVEEERERERERGRACGVINKDI